MQKPEGHKTFHTVMSTAVPSPARPSPLAPGPLTVPEDWQHGELGFGEVSWVEGRSPLAAGDRPLAA
jgi:hypothetical protein